nr:hypothetical protein [Halohasta salina]
MFLFDRRFDIDLTEDAEAFVRTYLSKMTRYNLLEAKGNLNIGYDHEVHEAATLVMYALQERFDWAEDISGVGMGAR